MIENGAEGQAEKIASEQSPTNLTEDMETDTPSCIPQAKHTIQIKTIAEELYRSLINLMEALPAYKPTPSRKACFPKDEDIPRFTAEMHRHRQMILSDAMLEKKDKPYAIETNDHSKAVAIFANQRKLLCIEPTGSGGLARFTLFFWPERQIDDSERCSGRLHIQVSQDMILSVTEERYPTPTPQNHLSQAMEASKAEQARKAQGSLSG